MNRALFVACCVLMLFPRLSPGQDWTVALDAGLTLSQNAYSDNWTGGEAGSATWMFLSNSLAERQFTPKLNNKNTLRLQFGQSWLQDTATKDWGSPVKSSDLIDLESVFRYASGGWADPFVSGRVQTQFLDESVPGESIFLNPADFTETIGAARVFVKEDTREWSARIGAGLREHLNRNLLDPADGSRSTETTLDGGIEFVNDIRTPLAGGRMSLQSKLIVFQALFFSKSDELKGLPGEDDWRQADVNWENILTAQLYGAVMVNFYTQFLYDREIERGGRFKQTLGVGLTWKYERLAQ